jgi:hypothetical protein
VRGDGTCRGLQNWLTWAQGLAASIASDGSLRDDATRLQLDTFATMGHATAQERAIDSGSFIERSWCQAELQRLRVLSNEMLSLLEKRKQLVALYWSAEENGERGWQLRIAISLAELDLAQGYESAGRKLLQEALAIYPEGESTRDVRHARQLVARGSNPPCNHRSSRQ